VKFACLCCGNRTLDGEPPGTYDICPVCYWEDDPVQGADLDARGGANSVSLSEARCNFSCFGAADERFVDLVRPPRRDELPMDSGSDGGCQSDG
jgi:hypothetical protein